jgi:hypothetical protein
MEDVDTAPSSKNSTPENEAGKKQQDEQPQIIQSFNISD